MTYALPTLRPGHFFRIDNDPETGKSFLVIYRDIESEPPCTLVRHELPFMPDSYAHAIATTAAHIEGIHHRLFLDSPATERSRYQHALNTLLEENDQ